MSRAETIERLKAVPLFESCTGRQLRRIASQGWEHTFEPGQAVCEEGSFADEFFVILEGHAVVREGGRKRGTLGPGDYFGEIALLRSSLIERSRRTATVAAVDPLSCFLLGRSQFQSLLYEEDVALKILRAVVQRLDASADL
jgi:PPM family protein phosphatase